MLLMKIFWLQELQELHSSLEEAKADIVGLWALRFLITQVIINIVKGGRKSLVCFILKGKIPNIDLATVNFCSLLTPGLTSE